MSSNKGEWSNMKNKDDLLTKVNLLTLIPMEDYQAPDLPTYIENKPDISKKIPYRWKNKVMIAAVAGLFGMTTLSGCSVERLIGITSDPSDPWTDWMHHGGSGGAPLYVAYLTEQEALGIIRSQLEEVGLNFVEPKKQYSIQIDWNTTEVVLVNEENDIRIALVDHWWSWNNEERETKERLEFTENAINQFADEFDINVNSVIFNPQDEVWARDDGTQRREEIEADIIQQVQDFVDQLRKEGIIE